MADYLIGIDLGTAACKTGIFDAGGNRVAFISREYPLYFPHPMYSEQDPQDWWDAVAANLRDVLNTSGIDPKDVRAIGVGAQAWGHVFLDSEGNVLRPAIIYSDLRATKQAEWMMNTLSDEKRFQYIGNPLKIDPTFSPCRLLWIKENEPEVLAKTYKVLQPKDFINYKLTGSHATDTLSAAGLVNLLDNKYYQEYFDILGIPMGIMPDVHGISEPIGKVTAQTSRLTGLAEGTPVVGGWMDVLCCSLGCGLVDHGVAIHYSGSSETICIASKDFAYAEALSVGPVFDLFFIGGGTSTSGYSLKWFRDTFGQAEMQIESQTPEISAYALFDKMADTVPPGSEGLIFLPYLSGERCPIWDPFARGVFLGITKRHTRAHFIRAILEGVAFSMRQIYEIARQASGIKIEGIRIAGGGGKSNTWNQIKADVIGETYFKLKELEVGASGAAMLAGMGAGIFKDQRDASHKFVRVDRVIKPDMQNHAIYDKSYAIYKEMYPLLKDTYARLAEK